MKKNLRVVQINGFRGLFLALFIISCLIAGFIAFPSFLAMSAWNYLAVKTGSFVSINFWQGLLLWAIIAFSVFLFAKKQFIVSFNAKEELSDAEINEVISKIKSQAFGSKVIMPNELQKNINIDAEHKEELSEVPSEHKDI